MNPRQLHSFLAVADTLHFGRAAAAIGLSQPTLSQHVRRLEAELGVTLFERTSRAVALTDAGQALLVGARRVITEVERAQRQCREAAAGGAGQLMVASTGAALNSITPPIVAALRRRVPGIAVQLEQMDTPLQLAAVRDGRLDVGVVRGAQPSPGLRLRPLIEEPLVAVVPSGHRLVDHGAVVDVGELRDESFVLWPRSAGEEFHDQVTAVCRQAGFSPRVAMEGMEIDTLLGLVSAGIGVSLQPASFSALARDGVAFLRLPEGAPRSQLQLVWPALTATPATTAFLEIADEIARSHGPILNVGPYASIGSGGAHR